MSPALWSLAQAVPPVSSMNESLMQRLSESWVVAATLVVLLVLSLASWFIIVVKSLYFRKVRSESREFVDAFWRSTSLDHIYRRAEELPTAPVSKVFKAGYVELTRVREQHERGDQVSRESAIRAGIPNVERALRRATLHETTEMERWVPLLATTGSAAPFIGLFGTVWGIMEAFTHLGAGASGQNMMQTVIPYIAEALVATAIGLLAAIPAVMAYNYFVRKIRVSLAEIDNFSSEFLNIVNRHFFS